MPFELKNSSDNFLIHSNQLTTQDFETGRFDDGSIDGTHNLSFPFGDMKMSQWVFNGIRMTYSEYDFKDYAVLDWKGDFEMVTMYFNLWGKFSLRGNGMDKTVELGSNQHNMFYGKSAEGQMKVEELKMKSFMLQLTKGAFLSMAGGGNDAIKRFADNMASGKSIALSDKNLEIDLSIQNCINSILNCPYSDSLKKLFFFSKTIELLVLQAESYNKILSPGIKHIKTDYDRERILFARDYLVRYLEAPPSLTELSRISGINEFKLKRGFKEVFGQTVFGYLNDIRMELAKNDLQERKKSITEIAFELGYSSVQHFSSAFKKKYGMSPGQVKF